MAGFNMPVPAMVRRNLPGWSICGACRRDDKLLKWISDSGVAAPIADNYVVETHPARAQPLLPDRTAAAPARCGGFAGDADRYRLK